MKQAKRRYLRGLEGRASALDRPCPREGAASEGKKYREIAAELGISIPSVSRILKEPK